MSKRIELDYRGTMLGDYFCGTTGVMISLGIDNKTTVKEVFEMLESEINVLWGHIEYTFGDDFSGDLEVMSLTVDSAIKDFMDMNKDNMGKIMNPNLDFCFDDIDDDLGFDELPVCIFTLEYTED